LTSFKSFKKNEKAKNQKGITRQAFLLWVPCRRKKNKRKKTDGEEDQKAVEDSLEREGRPKK